MIDESHYTNDGDSFDSTHGPILPLHMDVVDDPPEAQIPDQNHQGVIREEGDAEFRRELRQSSRKDIYYEASAIGFVNLASVQRMYINTLRRELVFAARQCYGSSDTPPDYKTIVKAGKLLGVYCDALDRYKQMISAEASRDDPFVISTVRDLDRKAIQSAFRGHSVLKAATSSELYGHTRGKINLESLLLAFFTGIVGGLALLGPMLLMVLHKDLLTTLVTVSVAVIVFSAGMAYVMRRTGFKILTATAAYAAVLVVFVGASS